MKLAQRFVPIGVGRFVVALIALLGVSGGAGVSAQESAGQESTPWFIDTACREYTDSVVRLYTAAFGRQPDYGGFEHWLGQYQQGQHTLSSMAAVFVGSAEFEATYGALSDRAFVEQVYRNVLGREGDAAGVDYWTAQVSGPASRGDVLLQFSESPENVEVSGTVEPILGYFNNGHEGAFGCLGELGGSFTSIDGSVHCETAFYMANAVMCHTVGEPFVDEPQTSACPKMGIMTNGEVFGWMCAGGDVTTPTYAPTGPTAIYVEHVDRPLCRVDLTSVACGQYGTGFRITDNTVTLYATT